MNLLPDKAIETQSITRLLTASLIITVLVVSVIAVTAMHRVVSQTAIRGLEQKADETLAYLVGTLEMPLWAVDEEGVKNIGKAVSQDESIARLIIRNESGAVIFSIEKENSGGLINRSGQIIHKQWQQEKRAGDVSVSLTPAIYNESNRRLLFFLMLIIVCILIAIAIVSVVFIRRSLDKPLKSLSEITSLFAAGVYDISGHTLPYLEFQPFGKALAEMAGKIESQIRMVRKGEEDLRRMNERFVLATHAAQVGVWDWDIPKNELLWDDSMYLLYGIQKGDFGGAYDAWARTIHPEDKAQTEGEIQAALRGEREYAPEFRIVRPDGAIRYLKADSQTFRDEDGQPLRMVGTNIDITERKRTEEKISTLNQELEQRVEQRTAELSVAKERAEVANRAKSAFLSNMSHELRTPLNAILGYTQILKLQNNLTARQQQRMDIIRTSSEHLLMLINDILDVGKIEAQKMELEEVTFNLSALLGHAFNISKIKAEEKDLEFQYEADATLPEFVRGDERKLRQILLNLLSNSVKYTRHGEVTLRVSYGHTGGLLLCEVMDSGIGIAPDQMETIFEPFTQLAVEGEVREGTGLGLTITRQLVTLMRGRIAVESEPGKGSVFRVELPLTTVTEEEFVEKAHKSVTGYAGERKKILVVDDNIPNASMLVSMLEPLGFAVVTAGNGREAVVVALVQRPDLVLLDLVMPEMDGLEAAKEMKRHRELAETRIIGISALVTESSSRDEFIAACDDFVAKPIRIDALLEKIEAQLGIVWETALPDVPLAAAKPGGREEFDLPPEEEILDLYDLARRGDMRRIQAWATALEEGDNKYGRFAFKLRELAGGFKAKAILALLEDYKGKHHDY